MSHVLTLDILIESVLVLLHRLEDGSHRSPDAAVIENAEKQNDNAKDEHKTAVEGDEQILEERAAECVLKLIYHGRHTDKHKPCDAEQCCQCPDKTPDDRGDRV
jgi:hypothetical protein